MKERLLHFLLVLPLLTLLFACKHPENVQTCADHPPIYPDYIDVAIPYNIAPLNFLLRNKPEAVEVVVKGDSLELVVRGRDKVQFPIDKWRNLLYKEKGHMLSVEVTALVGDEWIGYAPFRLYVSPIAIDSYLSYRLIEPSYEVWNKLQLIGRDLSNFDEEVLADNNQTEGSCMNCHIYSQQDARLSFFHLRGAKGGMILNRDGKLRKFDTQVEGMPSPAVYGSLHPSGRYGVFSTNTIIPEFHTQGSERLEVYDTESDLMIVDFDTNTVIPFPSIDSTGKKPLRTFPEFNHDGNCIYYCEAPYVPLPDSIRQLKYSLLRIPFDAATATFGNQVDTIYSAQKTGKSVSFPKLASYDQHIVFTLTDYGTFPIWHREADLHIMNPRTGETGNMAAANSDLSDTYHSWSSIGHWLVFASKRDDGIYGKPYITYVTDWGAASKPFLLPQRDPAFYDYTLKSFNIPEFYKSSARFDAADVERIYHKEAAEPMKLKR